MYLVHGNNQLELGMGNYSVNHENCGNLASDNGIVTNSMKSSTKLYKYTLELLLIGAYSTSIYMYIDNNHNTNCDY